MRWGICSVGLIAKDFCNALKCLNSEEHTVTAVVSKSLEKAKEFAAEFNIPNVYDSYEEFAKDSNVDMVYISTINSYHHRLSILMLNNGKPVLCEKTLATSTKEAKEILQVAKDKKLFFMEALWSNFFPSYKSIRQEIDAGSIGDVQYLDVAFFVDIFSKERISQPSLGGGAIFDIGVYTIWLSHFIFRQKPETITAVGTIAETGVDQSANIILTYKNGARASLCYNSTFAGRNDVHIFGSKGSIYIPSPFWSADKFKLNGKLMEFPLPKSDACYNYPNSNGLAYEAECVLQCFKDGHLECPAHMHSDTLAIIEIIDEVKQQLEANHQKK
ncbi:trans-1,2-dihydrobenzene-1,2-diol dehydrogenase-like [Argonauta hians]